MFNDIDFVKTSNSLICLPDSLIKHINTPQGLLTILHANISSINCNFDNFIVLLESNYRVPYNRTHRMLPK